MSLKILGGKFKGFRPSVPKGVMTRPTSVLLRRRLFDSFQNLTGTIFIDAYAGTGAVGIEALSRGADSVYFVEKFKKPFLVLKKNLSLLETKFSHSEVQYQCELQEFKRWLIVFKDTYETWQLEQRENTLLFFDPPYEFHDDYKNIALADILGGGWFLGQLWLESDNHKGVPLSFWQSQNILIKKTFKQGSNFLIII